MAMIAIGIHHSVQQIPRYLPKPSVGEPIHPYLPAQPEDCEPQNILQMILISRLAYKLLREKVLGGLRLVFGHASHGWAMDSL